MCMRILTDSKEEREQEERDEMFLKKLRFMGRCIHELQRDKWKDVVDEGGAVRDRVADIRRIAEDILAADNVIIY